MNANPLPNWNSMTSKKEVLAAHHIFLQNKADADDEYKVDTNDRVIDGSNMHLLA